MDLLTKFLMSHIQDQQTAEILAVVFIAGTAFCIIFAILLFINNFFDPVRSRFLKGKKNSILGLIENEDELNIYQRYSHILLPSDGDLNNRTMQRLHHAGYHSRKNLFQYYAIRLFFIIVLPILTLIGMFVIPDVDWSKLWQALMVAAVLGFISPSFVLDKLIRNRQKIIQRAFPDVLDLLVVCTEAGLSLDAALQKVASEVSFSQPELAGELNLVIAEIRAGIERKKAFNGLAQRTGVEDIRGLMSSINQSMRFGSSIAQTLRVYSEDFRDKRMQAAEEKAAKIAAKLIFPTALCLLPCFILIILVPFGLTLMKSFSNF